MHDVPNPRLTAPAGAASAYQRAAEASNDPRCTPIRLDGAVPEGDDLTEPTFSERDHATWRDLMRRQRPLLDAIACDAFLEGLDALGMSETEIPSYREIDRRLQAATGWRIARIPGLLHERDFFAFLARRVFPCTDTIRPEHELDYTPAPDLFHDVFGHTPMIVLPRFADFYQRLGEVALSAEGEAARAIERFYWFTVEFGLIRQHGSLRVFGNGILSSHDESRHCLTGAVERLPFDAERVAKEDYDVWHLQQRLFVIESFDQLADEFEAWSRKIV